MRVLVEALPLGCQLTVFTESRNESRDSVQSDECRATRVIVSRLSLKYPEKSIVKDEDRTRCLRIPQRRA